MRAYGSHNLNQDPPILPLGFNYAPPSKEADLTKGQRRLLRRLYNHKTRQALKKDLRYELTSI